VYHARLVRRPLLAALLAAVAAGCAHGTATAPAAPSVPSAPAATTAPAPPAPPADPLADLRDGVESLLAAQGEAAWRGWTAGEPADPAAAWQGREALVAPEALARVGAARAAAPESAWPGLDRLRAFLLGERLARESAAPAQALAAARAAATFTWNLRTVPLRQAGPLLAAEPEGPRRQALAAAHTAAARKLLPLQAARDGAVAAAGARLGFSSTLDLAAALRGEEVDGLAALAEATLARTEATWLALLEALARRDLLTPSDRLRQRDLPRVLRTTVAAEAFPAERLLPDAEAALAGLGLDLTAGGRLTVDAASRPGKLSRPLAVPVRVPDGVRLSLAPVAGLDAARALLHELGVAQAAARAAEGPVEDRRLGSAALAEAWGALLAGVVDSPEWLADRRLDPEEARRTVRVAAARRLLAARLAAARLLVEVARVRDPAGAPARAAALGQRALGLPVDATDPAPWDLEPDPLLRCAEALQAALLAAQVEAHLAATASGPWWRARTSGDWLRAAWGQGGRRSPAAVARALGAAGLDPAPLDALVRAAAAAGGVALPPAAGTSAPAGG
jgi:hypothetical protein